MGGGAPAPEVEAYLAWLAERGRAPNTLAAYRRDLAAYARFLAARGLTPATVSGAVVAGYPEHLAREGRKPASVARALAAVRSLHRFLLCEGRAAADPALSVSAPQVPPAEPRALSEPEVDALLGVVGGDDAIARRDRAILEVLYGCGLRISELVNLTLADLDFEAGAVRVAVAGGRGRVTPLGEFARDALRAWLAPDGRGAVLPERASRTDADAVFLNARGRRLSRQGAWGIVRRHGQRAGLADRLSPHVLRRACAAHLRGRGADPRVVEALLGRVPVMGPHDAGRPSVERLRQVYEAAHPRAVRRPAG